MRTNKDKGSSSMRMVFSLLLILAVVCVSATIFVSESEDIEGVDIDYTDDQRVKYKLHVNNTATVVGIEDDFSATEVTIPDKLNTDHGQHSVTTIGKATFRNCVSLTSISMNSVTSIGDFAFEGCTPLTSVSMNSVTEIGESAFQNTGLTSVSIPNSVKEIDAAAFQFCTSLTSVSMNSVTSISEYAFFNCTSLTSVSMNSVTSIGKYAFFNCISLPSVFMNNVTSIGKYAFYCCTSLPSVSMNSVTSIDSSAFQGCTSLTSISLPNSVETIDSEAFQGCTSLTSITMPNNLTLIGDNAFAHCDALSTVTISGEGTGGVNILGDYFSKEPWIMKGQNYDGGTGKITTLIIDTSDAIDIKNVTIIEGNILKITSSSKSVTGPEGKMFSGKRILSNDEISGKRFIGTDDGTGTMVWKHDTRVLSLHADDPNYGDVIGSGIYEYDSFVQISAIPKEGYSFVSWSDGNTDEKRTLKITANRSLTAYFAEEDPTMCKVTVIIEGNGMVYGMGTVEKGTVITLNAVADNGHSFQGWSHTTYTGTTISLSVESNMVITATFSATDTGIGGASNSLIDTTTAIVIILIIVIVFGSIVVISLVRGRRSA